MKCELCDNSADIGNLCISCFKSLPSDPPMHNSLFMVYDVGEKGKTYSYTVYSKEEADKERKNGKEIFEHNFTHENGKIVILPISK